MFMNFMKESPVSALQDLNSEVKLGIVRRCVSGKKNPVGGVTAVESGGETSRRAPHARDGISYASAPYDSSGVAFLSV